MRRAFIVAPEDWPRLARAFKTVTICRIPVMASFQTVVICAFVNIVLLTAFVNSHVEENSIQNDDTNKNAGASGLPETPTSTVGSTPNSVLCNIKFIP